MMDAQVLVDKLNSLSVEDLYLLMKDEGVTGVRQAAAYCVVANYLKKHEVVSNAEIFGVCPVAINIRNRCYDVSLNLRKFIMQFDQGDYPDLSVGDMAALDRFTIEAEMECIGEALV